MLHAEGTERRAVRAVARSTAYGMATIALCVLLVSAGGISAEKSDANSDVEGSVKKLLQDLGASDTVKRSDAERGLVAAHERYVRMLLANCTDTDAETSRRIAAILGKVRVISEIGEWSAHLSDSGRAKFE